jgi:hypothetical protein
MTTTPWTLLPPDLIDAVRHDNPDPLQRFAALAVMWRINPLDVTCRDLLMPGGRNALPQPETDAEWAAMYALRDQWLEQINLGTEAQ